MNIYQIYYDKDSYKNCYYSDKRVITIFNEVNPHPYFENPIISHVVKNTPFDRIGVFSHKYGKKVGISLDKVQEREEDVVTFFGGCRGSYWGNFERWHNGGRVAMGLAMEGIGCDYNFKNPKHHIYQNHFVTNTDIYREYVDTILDPVMQYIDSKQSEQLTELINRKPNIGKYKNYTMHSFLCERLFTIFYHMNDHKYSIHNFNKLLKN